MVDDSDIKRWIKRKGTSAVGAIEIALAIVFARPAVASWKDGALNVFVPMAVTIAWLLFGSGVSFRRAWRLEAQADEE